MFASALDGEISGERLDQLPRSLGAVVLARPRRELAGSSGDRRVGKGAHDR
jgi:hypothetical protein